MLIVFPYDNNGEIGEEFLKEPQLREVDYRTRGGHFQLPTWQEGTSAIAL